MKFTRFIDIVLKVVLFYKTKKPLLVILCKKTFILIPTKTFDI